MTQENTRKITCVAILTKSGILFRGKKWDGSPRFYFQHNHLVEEIMDRMKKEPDFFGGEEAVTSGIRGYLDNSGKFLTREEASIVAKEAGQLVKDRGVPYPMKSADILWVTN